MLDVPVSFLAINHLLQLIHMILLLAMVHLVHLVLLLAMVHLLQLIHAPGSSFSNGSSAIIDTPGSFVNASLISLGLVITYNADLSNSSALLMSVELVVLKVSTQSISKPPCVKSAE